MIPLAWVKALAAPDGTPFLADGLARYGYLPNPGGDNGLPIGFTTSGPSGDEVMGMNCAACHTRQIVANGQNYRVDGGPALVDFQSFLADLDQAVLAVLKTDGSFTTFSTAVLGSGASPQQVAELKAAVSLWSQREHTLMSKALPRDPWGLGRLDAVGMIFNRLAGLDLGRGTDLPDRGQYPDRGRADPLSLPVERPDPGQNSMARFCRQRQRHPRPLA